VKLIIFFTLGPDIMLVVDGSASVNFYNPNNFNTLIEFVVRVTREFPDSTHMGLVQFSEQSELLIRLGNITDERELECAIRNITYQDGGDRNTGTAIRQATNELFNTANARDYVSKLMLLFTDGAPTNPISARNAGEDAREMGVEITAVGINIDSAIALPHLVEITGSQDRVLLVDDFHEDQLDAIVDELTGQVCQSKYMTYTYYYLLMYIYII